MANYILRTVDDRLWTRFKKRVQENGHSLRWVILELVEYYSKYGMPTPPKEK